MAAMFVVIYVRLRYTPVVTRSATSPAMNGSGYMMPRARVIVMVTAITLIQYIALANGERRY